MDGGTRKRRKVSWRRSRPKQMQLCLDWPGSSLSQETSASSSTAGSPAQKSISNLHGNSCAVSRRSDESTARPTKHKRRRQVDQSRASSKHVQFKEDPLPSTEESTKMWTDKYAPKSSADVVIAPKKMKDIQQWLEEALLPGSPKFLLLVGSPGIGKSTAVECLALEKNLDIVEWRESFSSVWNPGVNPSIEYESPISSFETFLTQNAVGYGSLDLQTSSSRHALASSQRSSLVLLQEMPYCHDMEAEDRLRRSLTDFVRGSVVPTVLIFSDVTEGKHRPSDLERLIESNILYSQLVRIMTVSGATKARMKKCLESVAKAEGVKMTPSMHNDLHLQSGGDIRHALMTLQFDMAVGKSPETSASTARDPQISVFHALGKLLYAKRDTSKQEAHHERPPLDFDPERVVEQTGMDVSRVLEYIQYNGLDFFTDTDDLCEATALVSDAALWMLCGHQNGNDPSSFPSIYAASVAGRTIAHCNKHPAATKFRPHQVPPAWSQQARHNFEILEKQIERQAELGRVRWSVETSSWAQERVSYLQTISPNESISLQSFNQPNPVAIKNTEAELAEKIRREQELILRADDIEEFPDEKATAAADYAPLNFETETSVSPKSAIELLGEPEMMMR